MKLYKTKTFNKEIWDKASKEGFTGLQMEVQTEIKASGDKYHAVFSTESEDRHGEIVYQNFDLKAFKKNPVYLDSHNYNSIEHIIGKIHSIKVKDGKLEGDIEWALDNPKGLLAKNLADGGFLNTSSIGFIPKEFDEIGNIVKSELLEISAVAVPANPEALLENTKQNEQPTEDNREDTGDDTEKGEDNSEEEREEDSEEGEEPEIEDKNFIVEEDEDEEEEEEETLDLDTTNPEEKEENGAEEIFKNYAKAERETREKAVNEIAKHVQKIKEDSEVKRKIFQSLRDLLKKDIASY